MDQCTSRLTLPVSEKDLPLPINPHKNTYNLLINKYQHIAYYFDSNTLIPNSN